MNENAIISNIIELKMKGKTTKAISHKLKISISKINNLIYHNKDIRNKILLFREARNKRIAILKREGKTLSEIGKIFNMTESQVFDILHPNRKKYKRERNG